MDIRPKCKTKSIVHKRKTDKLDFLKIKMNTKGTKTLTIWETLAYVNAKDVCSEISRDQVYILLKVTKFTIQVHSE